MYTIFPFTRTLTTATIFSDTCNIIDRPVCYFRVYVQHARSGLRSFTEVVFQMRHVSQRDNMVKQTFNFQLHYNFASNQN